MRPARFALSVWEDTLSETKYQGFASRHRYSKLIAQHCLIFLCIVEQTFLSAVLCGDDQAHSAESYASFGSSARANAILSEMRLRRGLVEATHLFVVGEL